MSQNKDSNITQDEHPLKASNNSDDDSVIEYSDRARLTLPETYNDILPKNHRLGAALILISCILFGGAHISVRYASERLSFDPIFISIFRGISSFMLITTVILYYGIRRVLTQLPPKAGKFLFIRGFLGSIVILCKYESLARLPVGISVSLFSTTPIFAAFFGWILVREALTKSDLLSMAMCLCGTILVGSADAPFKTGGNISGVTLALLSAAVRGLVYVIIRMFGTKVHFFFSVQALSIGSMMTPFLYHTIRVGTVDDGWDLVGTNLIKCLSSTEASITMSAVAVFSFSASMCVNRGLQLLKAGNSATLKTFDIPVNFLMGFLVMGELLDGWGQVVGCALVAIGVFVNVNGRKGS